MQHIQYQHTEVVIDGRSFDRVIAYDETGTVVGETFIPNEFE